MKLFAVVIEELDRRGTGRALLDAAEQPAEAEATARDFYLLDRRSPSRSRFSAQPISAVAAPGSATDRVVVRRFHQRH